MSELLNAQEPAQAALSGQGTSSAGAMLRAAREAQGLHIGALAVALKVPVKKLEALEADRFDLLPDTVFVRALASSICRVLKIDPAAVLAALPLAQVRQIKSDETGLNTAFKEAGNGAGWRMLAHANKPVTAGVFLLLLAILAIVFWPQNLTNDKPVAASESAQIEAPGAAGGNSAVPSASTVLSDSTAVSFPQAGASDVAAATVLPDVLGKSAAADNPSVLMLQVSGTSWVEVTDGKGVVQLRKTAVNGEVLNVAGDLPLSVVLGRADSVSVRVRGKPLDLTAISKDNVAKFEVK